MHLDNMIRIENLGFSYGDKVVLNNISMSLEKGRIYGLLGENGVGKTTLLTNVSLLSFHPNISSATRSPL